MSFRLRLVLSSALLCGALAPVASIAHATPAVAQSVQPERTVFGVRFLGEWLDDHGLRYVFTDQGLGRLKGEVTRAASGELVATIEWRPSREGMGGNFFVPDSPPSETSNDRGITGYIDHTGRAVLVVRAGRFPNGYAVPTALERALDGPIQRRRQGNVFTLRRPADHPAGDDAAHWSGRWRTTRGQLELRPEGRNLFGALKRGDRLVATERLAMLGDAGGVAVGAWEREGEWTADVDRGDLTLRLSPDGRSFSGWYTEVTRTGNTRVPWSGERLDADGSPAADTPAQTMPQPLPRSDLDAIVAKLKGAWRTPFGRVEFTEYEEMGFTNLEAQFTDPDTNRRHSLYSNGAGGLSLVTQPEGRVDQLTLSISADGRSFDVRGPAEGPAGVWRAHREAAGGEPTPATPTPQPPSNPPPPATPQPSQPGAADFKPLNRLDVRVDRVVVARGYPTHQVHAFVTVKNTSATPQYFTSGFVKVVLADADGVSWERSQPYRASGEPAELFGSTPVIQPGGELRVRYVFVPGIDARLTSITLSEGGKQAEFAVGGL